MNLNDMGKDYDTKALRRQELAAHPLLQFEQWFQQAVKDQVPEPNAAALATVDASLQPRCRMVLLKYFDHSGFVFFSNYQSAKGKELEANPRAAMTFWWTQSERQVRIEGVVNQLDPNHSDQYFHHRDRESQLAAAASPQSQVLASRQELENYFSALQQQYSDNQPIERPAHWGGYVLSPTRYEFWQGRSHRMHDRFVYVADNEHQWQVMRLAP